MISIFSITSFVFLILLVSFNPDVYVDVPDIIDISHMRSKGLQPGEEILPEGGRFSVSFFYSRPFLCN